MPWSIESLSRKIDDIASSTVKSDFVSNMVFSPYKNDKMKNLYHDFMKLPPKKDRRTHSMSAYFLGDNLVEYLDGKELQAQELY